MNKKLLLTQSIWLVILFGFILYTNSLLLTSIAILFTISIALIKYFSKAPLSSALNQINLSLLGINIFFYLQILYLNVFQSNSNSLNTELLILLLFSLVFTATIILTIHQRFLQDSIYYQVCLIITLLVASTTIFVFTNSLEFQHTYNQDLNQDLKNIITYDFKNLNTSNSTTGYVINIYENRVSHVLGNLNNVSLYYCNYDFTCNETNQTFESYVLSIYQGNETISVLATPKNTEYNEARKIYIPKSNDLDFRLKSNLYLIEKDLYQDIENVLMFDIVSYYDFIEPNFFMKYIDHTQLSTNENVLNKIWENNAKIIMIRDFVEEYEALQNMTFESFVEYHENMSNDFEQIEIANTTDEIHMSRAYHKIYEPSPIITKSVEKYSIQNNPAYILNIKDTHENILEDLNKAINDSNVSQNHKDYVKATFLSISLKELNRIKESI